MTTWYLDPDDEITSVVGRLRGGGETQVTMVVPAGSRIATSRINFRLLAREAQGRGTRLAVVSGEAPVRALAIAAGLLAYATVGEAEAEAEAEAPYAGHADSTAAGPAPRAGPAGTTAPTPAATARTAASRGAGTRPGRGSRPPDELTTPMPWAEVTGAATTPPRAASPPATSPELGVRRAARPGARGSRAAEGIPSGPPESPGPAAPGRTERPPRRRWLRARVVVPLLLLVGLGGAAVVGAYTVLPTAAITIQARSEPAGPVDVTVTADPSVAVADLAAGVVPARRVEIPLSVTDSFPSTGVAVTQTKAGGVIRFTSTNTFLEVPVPAGTEVSTPGGVDFVTTEAVLIPRASFETGPSSRDAPIEARQPGPSGNVAAGGITRVPDSLSAALVTAQNPEPTAGGRRVETKVVTGDDVAAATEALTTRLDEQLQQVLVDPATTPRGLTLYPETAERGRVTVDPPARELIEDEGPSFTLAASATASVVGVDEAALGAVAVERLRRELPSGYRLFEETIITEVGEGTVQDGRVVYQVQAGAERWQPPDRQALVSAIKGRKVSEARAILERYGSVQIDAWPEFVDTIPTQEGRINVSIIEPARAAR